MAWWKTICLCGVAWVAVARPAGAVTMLGLPTEALCAAETARNERLNAIPPQLLDAISLVESGRYSSETKATLAWPWTITAEGEGKYFQSKAEAIAEIKRLKARGVKNIDVGCMQINLMYHPDAFASLEEALEPANNVAYAARFLKGLYGATNDWPVAASYYHSQTPSRAAAYRERLMKVWNSGGSRNAIASLRPIDPSDPRAITTFAVPKNANQFTVPDRLTDRRVSSQSPSSQLQSRVEQDSESRQIATAYRQARLAEYRLRREEMQQKRKARGLTANGY